VKFQNDLSFIGILSSIVDVGAVLVIELLSVIESVSLGGGCQ
jgi:hypothetical protein